VFSCDGVNSIGTYVSIHVYETVLGIHVTVVAHITEIHALHPIYSRQESSHCQPTMYLRKVWWIGRIHVQVSYMHDEITTILNVTSQGQWACDAAPNQHLNVSYPFFVAFDCII
jgi:hypothetical protein